MLRRHAIIIQVSVGTSLLLVTPTARAEKTSCSANDPLPAACFPDVLCPQYSNYLDYRRSVVHISGPDFWGTGVLINNVGCTKPGDPDCGAPYVLTVAHLLTSKNIPNDEITQGDIFAIENEATFTLGYEAGYCGADAYSWEFALSGALVLFESEILDLMLLHLSTAFPAEAGPYFVGWGDDGSDEFAAITHACGGAKKIAIADSAEANLEKLAYRQAWIVDSWDQGSVLGGSSGGPLLTKYGKLIGVLSQSEYDVCPGGYAESDFIAIDTIVETIKSVTNNNSHWDAYDSNAYLPVHDVETNNEKYGPGEVVQISAKQQVVLGNGFHAEAGSNVHVIIVPAGP